jgi:hypothetical protein
VRLFISHTRLTKRLGPRGRLPRAIAPWALDSGGFTQLQRHGRWTFTPEQYVAAVRRYRDEIGMLEWAAPMDWMCEPWVITGGQVGPIRFHGTREARGLAPGDPEQPLDTAVLIHQRNTVDNLLRLRALAPDLPFVPVLQGWQLKHYQQCADLYAAAGIDLATEPLVGLGSVCRRQATGEIEAIVRTFANRGLRLHGFGVKTKGLERYASQLSSADSMAWSKDARHSPPLPGHSHKNCANCDTWALGWRARLLGSLPAEDQANAA